jgi:hypothetical protein
VTSLNAAVDTTRKLSIAQAEAATLRNAICKETASVCEHTYGKDLRSVILGGSLARDEGTFVREGDSWKALGDAEFFLIFREERALPEASATASAVENIEASLRAQDITAHIQLSAVHPKYLRKLPPHILTYELRMTGNVIWGDPSILSLIPAFTSADIPLEDAWRLLANRIVEQLEVAEMLGGSPEAVPSLLHYRAVKLFLDMATSLLVFLRAYQPSYRERAEALAHLADRLPQTRRLPFPIGDFSERVGACTRFKLQEETLGKDPTSLELWEEAVTYAHRLWRWELAQLVGCQDELPDHEAMQRWMKLQPWGKKLRGWAYVVRRCGWHRSWRQWPHWFPKGLKASPRYWVYAAASELFFRLPTVMHAVQNESRWQSDWNELQSWLPVPGSPSSKLKGWEGLASQIAWNYHEFVEMTRA